MIYVAGIVGIVMLALGAFGTFEKWRADRANDKLATLEQQVKAAQDRATALALLWSAQVSKTDEELRAQHTRDMADAQVIFDQLKPLPSGPSIHLSAPTRRVLDSATRLANRSAAATAVGPPPAAAIPAVPESGAYSERQVAAAWAAAGAAYLDAYGQWRACVTFYEGLRSAQAQP